MRISDLLREASSALAANRGRSLLTVLGIVIGIGSVIAMTALIGGATDSMAGTMGLEQSRVINIEAYSAKGSLSQTDVEQIELNVPGYEFLMMNANYTGTLSTKRKSYKDAQIMCVQPNYFKARGVKITSGRPFVDVENEGTSQVIVLDSTIAAKLFGDAESALGEEVTLNNDEYEVIGLCEASNNYYVMSYIPMGTAEQRLFGGNPETTTVIGYAQSEDEVESLAERTKTFLSGYLGVDMTPDDSMYVSDYIFVNTNKEALEQLHTYMATFQMIMVSVASVSLLVGGIGIMNMMLTNVTERIREIGLRKALGAKASDITRQFLLESVMICMSGGVLGILVGYAGAWGLSSLMGGAFADMMGTSSDFAPSVSMSAVLIATAVCAIIGIVFGYYPARRAAKLNPVESLRFQ